MNEEDWLPQPIRLGLIRYRCPYPGCSYRWFPSRWDTFFYPLHYAEIHLGINAFRNPFTEGS